MEKSNKEERLNKTLVNLMLWYNIDANNIRNM